MDNTLKFEDFPDMMAVPNDARQAMIAFLIIEIGNFLKGKKCNAFAAPFDVFLKGTVVQPDIVVICDRDKIKEDGCHGAPDLVIEIMSESSKDKDRSLKRYKYFESGVKEYWLVDPTEETIIVYRFDFENKKTEAQSFSFKDKIKSRILDGLEIDFSQFEFDEE